MRILKNKYLMLAMAVVFAGVLAVTSCGSKGGSPNYATNPPPTTTPPPPHTSAGHFHAVSIQYVAFSPTPLTVSVGDTVRWTNYDGITHTVVSDTGSELGAQLTAGTSYQHIFSTAGSFAYHCAIHTYMHGLVIVQ
jgi:plastocyanin